MQLSKYLSSLFLASLLLACGDDGSDDPAESEEDPSEHACEHVSEAGSAVEAAADPADAPELALGEEPYTIALVPGSAGYVRLKSPAEALLFVGVADVVTGLGREGEDDALPAPAPNEFCAREIPEHFDLDLEGDGPYVLTLGPAGVESVWLMYTSARGHAH